MDEELTPGKIQIQNRKHTEGIIGTGKLARIQKHYPSMQKYRTDKGKRNCISREMSKARRRASINTQVTNGRLEKM